MNSFLKMLRARFEGVEAELGDYVPWALDDKVTAYKFVEESGYRPARYARCGSISEAISIGEKFGQRFLVKQPNRHSSKGIYLLEAIDSHHFINLLDLKKISVDEIRTDGPEPDYWLAEECIDGEIEGKKIPFDYKIYCFWGRPTVIIQIDRNLSPPRVALFDGSFLPLKQAEHYEIDAKRWRNGFHVIPSHAPALLSMATELATNTDSPFVSVDCYCTADGPRFGEFTFAPGAPDVGMIKFSSTVIASLDRAIGGEKIAPLSGLDIDIDLLHKCITSEKSAFPEISKNYFNYIAGCGSGGDIRYAKLLTSPVAHSPLQHHFQLAARMVGLLNGDSEQAFFIWNSIYSRRGFVVGESHISEYEESALSFHKARALGNPWHSTKAAEIQLARNEEGALAELERLAATGYKHAAHALASYKKRFS